MGKPQPVPITGPVLKWAREESGLSRAELAAHLKVSSDTVQKWETGLTQPSKTQFNSLVDFLRRPSAIFFLPAPPAVAGLPTSLRMAPGLGQHKLTRNEVRQIRWARHLQEITSWILQERTGNKVEFALRDNNVDPESAGEEERASWRVSLAEQLKWKDSSQAFANWRSLLEARGVLVVQLQLGKNNTRGLSAWDDYAPLVGVNSAYHPNARIFTLFHEVGHLLTRSDSACLRFILPDSSDDQTERWCERFSAAFLLPANELKQHLIEVRATPPIENVDFVRRFASRLKVSSRALALRLQGLHLAPPTLYGAVEEALKYLDWNPPGGGGGAPAYERRLSQVGSRIPDVIFDAYREGLIPRRDLLDSLRLPSGPAEDLERTLSA